jgi:parallel beta-helix repeat protein
VRNPLEQVNNTEAQSIVLTRSTYNVIAGNTLSDATFGVAMSMQSSDNTVKENTISGVFELGIRVSMVDNTPLRNTIKENVICMQDPLSVGVLITGKASGNTVRENKIVGNGGSTVGIKLEEPTLGNVVEDNILNETAVAIEDWSSGNIVTDNVWDRTLKCPRR